MAVSKRTRYEVLRRDDFTCRYCRSKDNELHVDHVTPVSLGGDDRPSNLVAACKDCNLGKASAAPDGNVLEHLDEHTIAFEKARAEVVSRLEEEAKERRGLTDAFRAAWEAAMPPYAEMAGDWRASVAHWSARGLGIQRMIDAIEIASSKTHLPDSALYPYTCKILWNWVTDLEDEIRAKVGEQSTPAPARDEFDAFAEGARSVFDQYATEIESGLLLQRHIDGGEIPDRLRYARAA